MIEISFTTLLTGVLSWTLLQNTLRHIGNSVFQNIKNVLYHSLYGKPARILLEIQIL